MMVTEGLPTAEKNIRPEWWDYVKKIIRQYPDLKRRLEAPLPPQFTGSTGTSYHVMMDDGSIETRASFVGSGKGGASRPVERCVIHSLPPRQQRRFDAVDAAIAQTKSGFPDDWKPRLTVIDLVYFKKTHTIAGAALKIGCHPNTAGKWQADFIRKVADELDLP